MELPARFASFLPKPKEQAEAILQCNTLSARYGQSLTPQQAAMVVQSHSNALRATRRIEFGGEIPQKLIYAFCDSPFIPPAEYADTLAQLVEIFYHYKNETAGRMSDDELIAYMASRFNGVCQGSLDLLCHRELETLANRLRGWRDDTGIAEEEDPEEAYDE